MTAKAAAIRTIEQRADKMKMMKAEVEKHESSQDLGRYSKVYVIA